MQLHWHVQSLLACAILAHSQEVTVTLFTQGGCPGDAVAVTCTNLPQGTNQCCGDGVNTYDSAQFNGLPTGGIPAQGIGYNANENGDCGTACGAASGNSACVTCDDLDGANWVQPNQKRETGTSCTRVLPDQLRFANGQVFSINYETPQNVTARLYQLGRSDPWLRETTIPRDLLAFEVLEVGKDD